MDAFSLVRAKYPSSTEAGEALVRLGYLHSKSDAMQAIGDFTAFLSSYPGHPLTGNAQQSLGRLYLRTGDLAKAEEGFDKVAAVSGVPSSLAEEAALQSGFVKIMKFYADKDKSHLGAAIDSLSKLRSSARLNVRARADLGIAECTLLLDKPLEARDKYKAAAQAYAGNPYFRGMALYGIACCSQQAGELEVAAKDYDALLEAQSGANLAQKDASWKASALASTTASAQAAVRESASWGRIPASGIIPKAAYMRGECLYMVGRYAEAAQQFEAVLDAFPGTDVAKQAEPALARARMAKGGR